MNQIRAIIPAAGKGKRLQKISGDLPKAMFRVGDRPMLEIVLENLDFIDTNDSVIVTGRVSHDDVPKYLCAMDVLVHPTYREGFGHSGVN